MNITLGNDWTGGCRPHSEINPHLCQETVSLTTNSARNGNVEVPVHLLKAKQRYTVRKVEKDK
jgi:hypothetical protein